MDRTLFTPPMIETYRSCRRAYQLAFLEQKQVREETSSIASLTKRFLLKALSEINRGNLTNVPAVQKFIGQNWPASKLSVDCDCPQQERNIQAFRFVYSVLTNYVNNPYLPERASIAGVNLKVRARLPYSKIYLEDTFDLLLWDRETRTLEFVDYHLRPLRPFDPAWPQASLLVKKFLAERLQVRFPFERLLFTFCQLQARGHLIHTMEIDPALYALHFPDLVRTIKEMQNLEMEEARCNPPCPKCRILLSSTSRFAEDEDLTPTKIVSRSA